MIHGHKTRSFTSSTYQSWSSMKQRCLNKNKQNYHFYGGKGISICDRWLNSFENFLEDMGERPSGMSLDRVNSEKDYCKENCRWSTAKQQANNRKSNTPITFDGLTLTMEECAKKLGLTRNCIKQRIHRKWPLKKVLREK